MTSSITRSPALAFILIILTQVLIAQTTQFTFQGALDDNGVPANGNFDFQFLLFDASFGGEQVGSTISYPGAEVTDGLFSLTLNFGDQFSGPFRFLEIKVRPAGQGEYTTLSPRQHINSSPYAIRSLSANNSASLGGIASSQYVVTNDVRLSDARNPLPNSPSYIQNTTVQQASSNFRISGTGTANIINAVTQFNLNGFRVFHKNGETASFNLAVGLNAGDSITTGSDNSFFGDSAGKSNTEGVSNSFFGTSAGYNNTLGVRNSYFGRDSGSNGATGQSNSFFGYHSGLSNNSDDNSFFGAQSGWNNVNGSENTFAGKNTGFGNTNGNKNTLLGTEADVGSDGLTNATAIGAYSQVASSNSLVLGSINGVNGATTDTKVGIGTTAPAEKLDIAVNSGNILFGGAGCPSGSVAIGLNGPFGNCLNFTLRGNGTDVLINRPTGGEVLFRENNGSTQLRIRPGGVVQIPNLGTAGSTALCRNASSDISTCSSSIRYKSNVEDFSSGADILRQLRPVTFNWKDSGALDLGLVAEEVAEIEPLLVTYNRNGSVEGVKYDRIGVILVNVVKEQAAELEWQKEKVKRQDERILDLEERLSAQGAEIEALKALVCASNRDAAVCR